MLVRYERVIANWLLYAPRALRLAGYLPSHIRNAPVEKLRNTQCQQSGFDATNTRKIKRKETNANPGGF